MIIFRRMNIVPYKLAILARKNVFYYKTKNLFQNICGTHVL